MKFHRGHLSRALAVIALFLMLSHPAHAAGLTDVTAPIQTFVAALESTLSKLLALIAPHAAPTASVAPAAQLPSPTALSAAAVNAATASSAPPTAATATSPIILAQPQPLADAEIPAPQPPPLPSPPAAPNRAAQAIAPLASVPPAITTNYVTQDELTAAIVPNYVTQQQLAATIAQLQSSINNQLYSSTSTFASGGLLNEIAATNRINNLSNVTITNPSITGLTPSEISEFRAWQFI